MIYLSRLLGKPVVDSVGEEVGIINDIAIATGEVFPRVTSLAFRGPDKTPFMISWRKFVADFDGDRVTLAVPSSDIRFSYLQPNEVLLARDLLNKQIVDTQGMKVVRVNDLKLSESRNQLRLLGAEVGMRGILRSISPALEHATDTVLHLFGRSVPETIIAWNYMDLLDRDLSQVRLSVTHKRLHELHPADVADIMEQLSPSQRSRVFEHLDNEQAADAISELEDELQASVIDDLSERRASLLLAEMDPDDAADIVGDLPYDKAERLLRLMGVDDARAIRGLLGYREKTAGGIMTPEVTTVTDEMTVQQVIEHLRSVSGEHESIYYVYVVEDDAHLTGVISLRDLLLAQPETLVSDIAVRDLFSAGPDDDQESVAEDMSKYDLLALPVIDETGKLLGIVTVDDALDVLEEEAEEDLALATGSLEMTSRAAGLWWWLARRSVWVVAWGAIALGGIAWLQRVPAGSWASLLLPALAFMPLVLRAAEDVSHRAIAEMIDPTPAEDRPTWWAQYWLNAGAGFALGLVAGALAFGAIDLLTRSAGLAVAFGVATTLAITGIFKVGTLVSTLARRRAEASKPVSGTGLGLVMMLIGAVLYLSLSIAAAVAVAHIPGAL